LASVYSSPVLTLVHYTWCGGGRENSSSKHGEDSDWPAFIFGLHSHWCIIPGVAEGDENRSSQHGEDSDWPRLFLACSLIGALYLVWRRAMRTARLSMPKTLIGRRLFLAYSHWRVIPGVAEGDENSSSKHAEDLQLLGIEVVALGGRPDVPRHLQVSKHEYILYKLFKIDNTRP
jgi:hypothetical protein